MWADCLGDIDGVRLLSPQTVDAMATQQTADGKDLVTGFPSRFGLGVMLPFPQRPLAGHGLFGHYGLGGTVAFAHPEHRTAFGYTANQMLPPGAADPRTGALVGALLDCL